MILKYAIVLEDPAHNEIWQPKFEFEVLKNGKPISNEGCGVVKFTAGKNTSEEEGWHKFSTGWYKDWTTIGFNLRECDGEEVIVRLTTYDCAELRHFGYAYFTLNCSDGLVKIKNGENDNMFCILEGPEGFKYRWYTHNMSQISTERALEVPSNDTSTYFLNVIQPNNLNCFYTLPIGIHYINVSTPDENKGVVIGGGTYLFGETAKIIAKANDGYIFDYWSSGRDYYYDDTLKFEINKYSNNSFTAHFKSTPIMVDGIYYHLDKKNNSAEVARSENYIGNIVIPEQISYDGVNYNVTVINNGAFVNTKIVSLELPNNVTSIGNSAFYNCKSLRSINIPNSVTSIGSYAFSDCSSLTSITIPNSVTSIGNYAFSECSSLTSITLKAKHPLLLCENVFEGVSRSILVKVPCGSITKYNEAKYWSEFSNYVENPLLLTVNSNDDTMGFAAITKRNSCDDNVAQVQAQALSGYKFMHWSDGSTENPHILLVTEDMTLIAEFAKEEVDVDNIQITSANVYSHDGKLHVEGAKTNYYVLDMAGRLIYSGHDTEVQLPRGVYIVNVDEEIQKVVL